MDDCAASYQLLHERIDAAGEQPVGSSREIYLSCSGPRDTWITELQFVLQA